ncbi:MAG: hypothetical protein Q4G33_08170 [bacterium]|nr:hypothetical protein [bacterium]
MKKTVALSAALILAMGSTAGVMAASEPTMSPDVKSKLTVTEEKGKIVSLSNETFDKESVSVKTVLNILNSLNSANVKENQSFEIKSESDGKQPVDVYLRLSTESSAVNALYDSQKLVDTYDITIKDGNSVVYNSKSSDLKVVSPKKNEYVLDIFLGRFNEDDSEEIGKYDIEIAVPAGTSASQVKNAKKLKWEIVSDPVEAGATAAPTAIPTTAPTVTPVPVPVQTPNSVTAAVTQAPAASTAAPTAAPTGTPEPENSVRYIGNDAGEIKPGKYTVTAKDKEAVLKIYNKDGKLEREIQLNEKKPSQVVTLNDGESIVNEGPVNLKTYVEPTATPKATAKPTATSKTSSTSKTATSKPTTAKTNPKTDDSAPIAGAAAVGMFALGMMAYPSIEKRRKDND